MKILKGHNSDWHLKTYEQYDENFKGTWLRLTFENLSTLMKILKGHNSDWHLKTYKYYDENFKGT